MTNGKGDHSAPGQPVQANGWPGYDPYRDENELSLQDVFETLRKGKWIIVVTLVLVVGAVAAYTSRIAPKYAAATTVYINNQQQNPQLSDMLGAPSSNRNIANEVEILKSRTMAQRVAARLIQYGVVPGSGRPLTVLGGADTSSPPDELTVGQRLRGGYVSMRPVSSGVDMIEITATSTVPEEAALIADVYAEEYVAYNRNLSRSRMTASREFLSDVTGRFETDLEAAEESLTAFLNQEQVVAPEEEARQLIAQATQLQQLQYQTQHELGMAQAESQALQGEIEAIIPGLANKISSGEDLMIDGLIQQISRLKLTVEQKYARTPALREDPSQDPELMRTLDEIAALEDDLQERADRLVQSAVASGGLVTGSGGAGGRLATLQQLRAGLLEKQVHMSGLQARLDVLNQQLDGVKTELGRIPGKEIVLNRLERSLNTREQLYISLVEKLQEARIAEQSELGYVDIIDTALVPGTPVHPDLQRNLAMGFALGLMLGVGLAFVRSMMDNRIRRPEDVQNLGPTLLSVIPDMRRLIRKEFRGAREVTVDGHTYATSLISILDPLATITESYRRLATNLQFARPDKAVSSILVTSPSPGEGKTSTALNLAVVFAQMGRRTVYLEADLRRSAGHELMGKRREPGLVEILFKKTYDGPSDYSTGIENLYFIPAGRAVPNPAQIVESVLLRDFLKGLEEEFDVVVVDSPPVLAVADALSLAAWTSATVVVCSAAAATQPMLERTLKELKQVRASVAGVVLNRFDSKSAYGAYGSYHEYGYRFEGYGERSSKAIT